MIWKNNLLKDLRTVYQKMLSEKYGSGESKQLLDIVIESFFGYSKIDLALDPGIRLSESEILRLHATVKELLANKPIQYITGKTQFLDIELSVNESVLIPRPETEELVQFIIDKEKSEGLQIFDMGTGSGCIAIALKKNLPGSQVTTVDISREALKLAKQNSSLHQLDIDFQLVDILKPDAYKKLGKFDVVVSNPPYVTEHDKKQMQPNVLDYEPHSALFVSDNNPLQFYKAILQFCQVHLKVGGRVYFEINEKQGDNVLQLIENYGFDHGELHTDIHGKNRFTTAVKKS
jgi:release factor glutamine methyltransferase